MPDGKANLPVRHSLNLSGPFGVWVTVWVNHLTHILIHAEKSKFATKNPRKLRFSRIFGADSQIRTGDLILTKDALYRLSYISRNGDPERARTVDL